MLEVLSQPDIAQNDAGKIDVKVIDTDVHIEPRSFEELMDYIEAPWRDRYIKDRVPFRRAGFTTFDVAGRMDAYKPEGWRPIGLKGHHGLPHLIAPW